MSGSELLDLLTACHARIRRTLDGLAALSTDQGVRDPRAAATAEACARYLRSGLPLHAQDEDLSLAPRLRALPDADGDIDAVLDALEAEHEEIHDATRQVLAQLDRIGRGEPVPVAPERLDGLLRAHLAHEEAELFPLVPRLSPASRQEIVRELRARRAGP